MSELKCSNCGSFFEEDGFNSSLCPTCRLKSNSRKSAKKKIDWGYIIVATIITLLVVIFGLVGIGIIISFLVALF